MLVEKPLIDLLSEPKTVKTVGKQPRDSLKTGSFVQAMFIEPRGSSTIYSPKTLSALELEFEDGSL